MKIKNLYPFLVLLSTIVFSIKIEAKEVKKQSKSITTPKTNIEKFLGLEQNTPSQLSTISIKHYFQSLSSTLNYLGNANSTSSKKSTICVPFWEIKFA